MADDRFEDRIRAFARDLSRSISEVDLDEVADRLGVDRDRVHGAAGAVEGWLSGRPGEEAPLFSGSFPHDAPAPSAAPSAGPHPLDLPTDAQGRALSALDSGRWTLRPGSGRLSSVESAAGDPAPPDHADLAGELRARDWITADGAVTLVGRQALLRWCRAAEPSASGPGSAPGATGGSTPGAPQA